MEKLKKHIQGIIDRRRVKKEKFDSVKDVFHSLGVQTSLHGIPRILSSKHWYQRGLWTCLVLVTFGFLMFQIYQLVDEYTKYPIKTKVSMKRDTLQFPAVSLCNMNPVKNSSLSLISGSELKDIIDPVPKEKRVSNLNNIANEVTSSNPVWTSSYINGSTNYSDRFRDYSYYYHDWDWYTYYRWWDYWYNVHSFDLKSDQDDSFHQSVNDFGDYLQDQRDWEDDEWSEKIEWFKYLFQNQSKDTRKELGHFIENMLISCSFNGKKCSADNFTLFQTAEYGNCYTLSSDLFITRKTGPMNGLQLILQVEKFELLSNLIDGAGFRLVIHEPETFPFPQDEGYTISSGHETTIGMKMVRVVRAEAPYGMCDSGDTFYKTYGFRYTMQACLQICRHRKVVEICKCRPSELMDIKFMEKFNTTPVCSSNTNGTGNNKTEKGKHSNAKQCEEFIYFRIDEHYIDCECASPCRQTLYQSTISGRMWPKESFLEKELLNTRCEQFNYSYCDKYMDEKNSASFKDNFLKLVIYYEDMNYEDISEEPSYDGFRFLSDLGGAMGLFLGASLLSFLELVQLLVELFNYHRQKCRNRKIEVKKGSNVIVKPTKDTTVKDNIHVFTCSNRKIEVNTGSNFIVKPTKDTTVKNNIHVFTAAKEKK